MTRTDVRADVLVIEDEPVVVDAARRLLSPEGLTIESAADGDAARARLEAGSWRLILLDLMLPGVSGLELLELARRRRPRTPVVVITGYASAEKAVDVLRTGAFDFLPKPFDLDELLGAVHRALEPAPTSAPRLPDPERTRLLGVGTWTRPETAGTWLVGATRRFAAACGAPRSIGLPEVGGELIQGGRLARLDDVEGRIHRLWAPLSGSVVALNEPRTNLLARLIEDPFGEGWLARIVPADPEREPALLSPFADTAAKPQGTEHSELER